MNEPVLERCVQVLKIASFEGSGYLGEDYSCKNRSLQYLGCVSFGMFLLEGLYLQLFFTFSTIDIQANTMLPEDLVFYVDMFCCWEVS